MADVTALLRSAGFAGDGITVSTAASASALRGVTLRALIERPGVLADTVDEYATMQQEQFGPTAQRHVAALWLLQDVALAHAVLCVGLIAAHGISLRASSDGLAMELPRDMFFELGLAEDAVVTAAATSGPERAALYAAAREHLADLFAPLQPVLRTHLKAGARAFWACVTDMATGAICTGSAGRAGRLEEGLAAFDSGTGPLLHGERLVPSPAGPIRRRHGCCLLYTIEGMSLCFSCPRIPLAT